MLNNGRISTWAKITVCFALLLSLVVGCGSETTTKPKKKVIKKIIVVEEDEAGDSKTDSSFGEISDFVETGDSENSDVESREKRPLYDSSDDIEKVTPDKKEAEYSLKSYSWAGPSEYVIVYAKGNRTYENCAFKLQDYFKKSSGATLKVADDSAAATAKEILVGDTNRYKSKLASNEYRVALVDGKPVFEGGHSAMTEEAVKWFVSADYNKGKINLITGKCENFAATVKNNYKYVWGDEFGGNSLDLNKWSFQNRMGGTNKMPVLSDSSVVNVNEGLLKMTAVRYYNASRPMAEYATNLTISSEESMSYNYGYLEMRAMVPYYRGAWPSFWAVSDDAIGNEKSKADYFVEVDIFEVFSSLNTAIPNIHKWYKDGTHTQYNGERESNKFININHDNLRYEYHTYGFEWTPEKMTMSVDGVDYNTYDLNDNYDGRSDMSGFRDNLFILLNNHIYVSDLSYTTSSTEVNNKDLPFEYYVDYIRLYQKPGEGSLNYSD